jgi:hypothetical protein
LFRSMPLARLVDALRQSLRDALPTIARCSTMAAVDRARAPRAIERGGGDGGGAARNSARCTSGSRAVRSFVGAWSITSPEELIGFHSRRHGCVDLSARTARRRRLLRRPDGPSC